MATAFQNTIFYCLQSCRKNANVFKIRKIKISIVFFHTTDYFKFFLIQFCSKLNTTSARTMLLQNIFCVWTALTEVNYNNNMLLCRPVNH
jgi:hypothetical protein